MTPETTMSLSLIFALIAVGGTIMSITNSWRNTHEKETEKKPKKPICHYMECSYGSFERSFALPEHVDPKTITASSKDGILTVIIPKQKQEQQMHSIQIQ